ncbi:MAG: hypothetical protein RIR00_488, partial [Pseudomonadota bacterium]
RLPFRWERLQHQALAPLVPADVEQLQRVIGWAKELNLCILLDMHNYGTYFGQPLGSPEVPASAFIDVWLRLLKAFPDATTTAFGLMNEPAAIPAATWLEIAQQSVLALRQAGSGHLLMVASGRWSGAHEWAKNIDGVSAASQFRTFHDPRQNLVIELHQYADANHSGTGSSCVAASRMQAIMAPLALWSRQEKKRFFLGEFGANTSPACMAAMATLLDAMQDRSVWLGWTYWSAGPWWGAYPYSIAPAEQEAPQLTLLRRHLPP